MTRTLLVTGAAGFIGYHTASRLLEKGEHVVGLDNLNDYYDVSLKKERLRQLEKYSNFQFEYVDLSHREELERVFRTHSFEKVVHLAAQVGVRASIDNPHAYIDSNIKGFLHVLEGCRHHKIKHLVYASSSSVYGKHAVAPYSTQQQTDTPISLYAASKKANEVMAHAYSHLFEMPTTGLRFFTVYGPWGRPDMAVVLFARAIVEGKPIQVFNHGNMTRDFTYVDDVVEGIVKVLDRVETPTPENLYRLYNIGNGTPRPLMDLIEELEICLGRHAKKNMLPIQPGDIHITHADMTNLVRDLGYQPNTSLHEGIRTFSDWFCEYYNIIT